MIVLAIGAVIFFGITPDPNAMSTTDDRFNSPTIPPVIITLEPQLISVVVIMALFCVSELKLKKVVPLAPVLDEAAGAE